MARLGGLNRHLPVGFRNRPNRAVDLLQPCAQVLRLNPQCTSDRTLIEASIMIADLVPIVAITFGIAFVPSIVWIILSYFKRRRFMDLHHTERMAAIERGMDIPPLPLELIDGKSTRRTRTSLLPGLVWFFIGLALLGGRLTDGDIPFVASLIPLGVGLAYLIYYFVEGKAVEAQLLEHDLRPRERQQGQLGGPGTPL
jgi:hypothetical protein